MYSSKPAIKTEPEFPWSSKFQRSRLACLRCLARKLKCDGNIPCSHCFHLIHHCSYVERRKPMLSEKALTEKLAALQSRYDALAPLAEGASGKSLPWCMNGKYSCRSVDFLLDDSSKGDMPTASPSSREHIEAVVTTETRDLLIKTAMIYLPRCNFDIDSHQIVDSLKLPFEQQPHPALINAIMLSGT